MKQILIPIFLLIFISESHSQKTPTNNISQFDTLKIDNLSFPVYRSWQELISRQLLFDKQYTEPITGQKFYGNQAGVVYGVNNPNVNLQNYQAPNVFFWLGGSERFKKFFKNAPVGGFNPAVVTKDTVMFSFSYLSKGNSDERSSMLYTRKFIMEQVLNPLYREHHIDIRPSSNVEELKLQQQKIKSLYDSCYLFVDTLTSIGNRKFSIIASYLEDENGYSIAFFNTTRFKKNEKDIAMQYFFMVTKYTRFNKVQMSIAERKKWYEYFLPVIKNAFYKEDD